ncbi:hypothetical protein [Streptomyces sp. NPDC057682]|uniref:hypothetical protein n=1 Tax=Streptomyces sp. NPDC057682 TaxID=3346210 RepID=UPI0036A3E551
MNRAAELRTSVFGMPLPACLVAAVEDGRWMELARSPGIAAVFGRAPVRPVFHTFSGMRGMTRWWREELDEEILRCYAGTSAEPASPGRMPRLRTVIIGNLGPDLLFALDYGRSSTEPAVAFLGEEDSWRTVSANVRGLMDALDPRRAHT